jgi:hypothetical protein
VLAEVGARVGEVQVELDWSSFIANPQGLFLWEAFVTARRSGRPTSGTPVSP